MAAFGSMAHQPHLAGQFATGGGRAERRQPVRRAGRARRSTAAPSGATRTARAPSGWWCSATASGSACSAPTPRRWARPLTLGGNPYTRARRHAARLRLPRQRGRVLDPRPLRRRRSAANRDQYFLLAAARLAPGVSAEQARAQLDTVMDRIRRAFPQETGETTAGVLPMKDLLVADVQTRLVDPDGRGAPHPADLLRQPRQPAAGAGGGAAARDRPAPRSGRRGRPAWCARCSPRACCSPSPAAPPACSSASSCSTAWSRSCPTDLPRSQEIGLDLRVLGFTLLVSLASGLAFGLFPSLQLAGRVPGDALRDGTRGSGRTRFARAGLVVSEVALALMLLAGAGLLIRSFAKLIEVDPGFASGRLLTFRVGVSPAVYDEPAPRRLLRRARGEAARPARGPGGGHGERPAGHRLRHRRLVQPARPAAAGERDAAGRPLPGGGHRTTSRRSASRCCAAAPSTPATAWTARAR